MAQILNKLYCKNEKSLEKKEQQFPNEKFLHNKLIIQDVQQQLKQ